MRFVTGHDLQTITRVNASVAVTTDEQPTADFRATLHTLLVRWQGWRTDPSYPGRGRLDFDWHNRLDKTLAAVRSELDSLPADTDPITLAELARPLLCEFWPHRPGPIAEVAGQVAVMRALASSRPDANVS
jgi:hypothetical protein